MLEPTKMQSNADAHKNVTRPIPNSNVGQESEWIEAQSRYDHFPLNKNDVVTLIDFKYHYNPIVFPSFKFNESSLPTIPFNHLGPVLCGCHHLHFLSQVHPEKNSARIVSGPACKLQ